MSADTGETGIDPLVGQVVGERFRVEALLGEGGVGRVYRARHVALNRAVALKVLLAEHEGRDVLRERFRREADALAALSHPNIVSVTDFGTEGDRLYLVMELLEGRTLAELLREEALPPARGVAIVRQVLLALGYAHERGVVHRDLKPHNVFVRRLDADSDHVTVLDFGLARFVGRERKGTQLTRDGMVLGTPAYMAPEQASGDVDAMDARTDVYAAGLLLFEVLCRRRPFVSPDPGELLRAHLLHPPPLLSEVDPSLELPPGLQEVVTRALEKSPSARFAGAAQMLAALDAIDVAALRRRDPSRSHAYEAVSAPTLAAPRVAARKAAAAQVAPAGKRKPPIAVLAIGGLALLAAVAIEVAWVSLPDDTEPAGETSPPVDPAPEPRPVPEPRPTPTVRPTIRNPFADEPIPDELADAYAVVEEGRMLSPPQVRAVRAWGRANGDDPRAPLLVGHGYANVARSTPFAIEEYEAALTRDPSVRGDPRVLPVLLSLVTRATYHDHAAGVVARFYGREAIDSIDALLERRMRPEERRRLEALKERVST